MRCVRAGRAGSCCSTLLQRVWELHRLRLATACRRLCCRLGLAVGPWLLANRPACQPTDLPSTHRLLCCPAHALSCNPPHVTCRRRGSWAWATLSTATSPPLWRAWQTRRCVSSRTQCVRHQEAATAFFEGCSACMQPGKLAERPAGRRLTPAPPSGAPCRRRSLPAALGARTALWSPQRGTRTALASTTMGSWARAA